MREAGGQDVRKMKIIYTLSRLLGYVAMFLLTLMMLLTVADVSGRYLSDWFSWAAPITGTTEISEFMLVTVFFPSLAWCALARKHVRVEIVINYFSSRGRAIVSCITLLLSLGIYAIMAWRSFLEAMQVNKQTSLLQLPFTPFYWIFAVGIAIFCLAIAVLIIEGITEALKR
jgi:TRAP-type C4-dicarboxylate transport system permease small subunit